MPSLLSRLAAIAVALLLTSASSQARGQTLDRYNHELAKLDFYAYQFVEYPAQRHQLDAAITLAKAEIEALDRLARQYRPFTKFDVGAPLPVTIERVRLDRLAAELRLRDLKAQRLAQQRGYVGQLRRRAALGRQAAEQTARPAH